MFNNFDLLIGDDALGILNSSQIIAKQATHVSIDQEQLKIFAQNLLEEMSQEESTGLPTQQILWNKLYHYRAPIVTQTINWILVLDALNFCFWAEKGYPRWSINYQNQTLNGYWALAAALKRAAEEGIPLCDARYLSTIKSETISYIFRGVGTIPLFKQRIENIQEVGHILLEKYDGQFINAIDKASGSAIHLVLQLRNNFPSFADVLFYNGQEVLFLKRAQIFVAHLATALIGEKWGTFQDIEKLTVFADYKLPQVLRHYNILKYDAFLARNIDRKVLLKAGSKEEIEIRACTIWSCELLRRVLQQYDWQLNSLNIDQRLWLRSQNIKNMAPYHRTYTIYY